MKKLITNIKLIAKIIAIFFVDIFGFVRSFVIYPGVKKPKIFYGFNHFSFAKRYARRRYLRYSCKLDQLGKPQGILPYRDTKLVVFSMLDLKILQKRGYISQEKNYKKYFKQSYYKKS